MALHYDELALLVNELQPLIGGQVQRVLGGLADAWHLQIRIPGETSYLEVALDPTYGRVCLRQEKPVSAPTPSSFTMLLRKWLIGSRLLGVTLDSNDRVIRLRFRRGEENTLLIVELPGGQQNIILLRDNTIIQTVHQDARFRPGMVYLPPSSKHDPATPARIRTPDELRALTASVKQDSQGTQTRDDVRKDLTRALKRLKRRADNIERDLQRIQDSEALRHRADLLQTVWGKVHRGQKSVSVLDYASDMTEVIIPLDPAKSLEDQVAELYHTYKRLKRARGLVEERLLQTMEEVETLQATVSSLGALDDAGLIELKDRLHTHLRVPRAQTQATRTLKRRPFREFRSAKGQAIFVGRSAKDNDALTSRIARGNDVWMHARDWSGSHVILKVGPSPDSEDLLDAAVLAAHFSKGRNDTSVEVTWTHAKHVRRVKGGPPGRVTIAGGQTLLVFPEESRLKRLLDSELIQA